MPGRPRDRVDPYRLYLGMSGVGDSLLTGIAYATITVYWIRSGHLDPLRLTLLGTAVEVSYFAFQLPTGVLADLVSRRLCVILGWVACGAAWVEQAVSASYPNLLVAQVVFGLGAALQVGAQESWVAGELDGRAMTPVYLRATQLGLVAQVVGAAASAALAYVSLAAPLYVAGGGSILGGIVLAVVMPERNFRPAERQVRAGGVVAAGWVALRGQVGAARRAIVAVPGLVLLFAMIACVGAWSESFDRLWGKFLLSAVHLPHAYGLRDTTWFALIAALVAGLSLGSTEYARRRTERLGPGSVAATLLGLTVVVGVGAVVFALSRSFALALVALLFVEVARPAAQPLMDGWLVARVDPRVRATALSAKDMCDAAGQSVGGPVFGAIGTLRSVRAALLAGAAALVPAVLLLAAATRRMHPHPRPPVVADEPARAENRPRGPSVETGPPFPRIGVPAAERDAP